MSDALLGRIRATGTIRVHEGVRIAAVQGGRRLESVTLAAFNPDGDADGGDGPTGRSTCPRSSLSSARTPAAHGSRRPSPATDSMVGIVPPGGPAAAPLSPGRGEPTGIGARGGGAREVARRRDGARWSKSGHDVAPRRLGEGGRRTRKEIPCHPPHSRQAGFGRAEDQSRTTGPAGRCSDRVSPGRCTRWAPRPARLGRRARRPGQYTPRAWARTCARPPLCSSSWTI